MERHLFFVVASYIVALSGFLILFLLTYIENRQLKNDYKKRAARMVMPNQ
tara:strand:+ start:4532 stop:4681 length:150 start_codon:yes stop_codon:yes gene_type:complete